jgi:hypothetical protein
LPLNTPLLEVAPAIYLEFSNLLASWVGRPETLGFICSPISCMPRSCHHVLQFLDSCSGVSHKSGYLGGHGYTGKHGICLPNDGLFLWLVNDSKCATLCDLVRKVVRLQSHALVLREEGFLYLHRSCEGCRHPFGDYIVEKLNM